MKRSSIVARALLGLSLAVTAILFAASPSHAAPMTVGDPHNCEGLAQGSTNAKTGAPAPFDATQIPGSSVFNFTTITGASDYLVACQPHIPWQPNYPTNATWDGFGQPFQCVELIDRYDRLRWHDSYIWPDASATWTSHPSRFQQESNGGTTQPATGDILVWTNGDHIAVITYVNMGSRYATILEQNMLYNGDYYTTSRTLYFTQARESDGYIHFVFTGAYTAYKQDGTSWYQSSAVQPVGWLHAN